jgi:hypothetical protein
MDVLFKVTHEEPTPPSRLRPRPPRDLETICLKCLEKNPTRRYATAEDLAEDLRRFIAHEPILARPIRPGEHVRRWVRRHPALAVGAASLLLGGLGLAAAAGVSSYSERRRVEGLRAEVRERVLQARAAVEHGALEEAGGLIAAAEAKTEGEPALADLRDEAGHLREGVRRLTPGTTTGPSPCWPGSSSGRRRRSCARRSGYSRPDTRPTCPWPRPGTGRTTWPGPSATWARP